MYTLLGYSAKAQGEHGKNSERQKMTKGMEISRCTKKMEECGMSHRDIIYKGLGTV